MRHEVLKSGVWWILRDGRDDHLGPQHEHALDAFFRDVGHLHTFIDVGAHVGHFTLRALQQGARVHAIEPNTDAYAHLLAQDARNPYRQGELVSHNLALGDTEGTANLTAAPGLAAQGRISATGAGETRITTLDKLLAHEKNITHIKIDVQGHEGKVLAGARRTLARHKPLLVVELHDREYNDPRIRDDAMRELTRAGYKFEHFHETLTNDYYACWHESKPRPAREIRRARLAHKRWRMMKDAEAFAVRIRDNLRGAIRAPRTTLDQRGE